ncbi:hypothetical protein D4A92_19875 [Rhizobium rosettiformans]|uniref:Uncharacterized protein n=1 Tax=Rhizobium rosettiformans TaxID=1368430 RepID=A0ABX7EZT2_9HYPH|nr:hypothetical protein [Rhizobium rosettiformans]QRF53546.1 hypothetical protein D4A92_19875 [Rhizobium rosettiformans]
MKKISIIGQIAEIEREIAMRERVYPERVRTGKMRQAEAEMLMERALAIRATLMFCREHEADIRAFMASRAEVRRG